MLSLRLHHFGHVCASLPARVVLFFPRHMGSVGPNFSCPWCGRVGRGGYAPDWVGYPICSSEPHSCLWVISMERHLDLAGFRHAQLRTIFCLRSCSSVLRRHPPSPSPVALDVALYTVASFLGRHSARLPLRGSPHAAPPPTSGPGFCWELSVCALYVFKTFVQPKV